MKTIGIIGGTSWHSTVDYYRLINEGVAARLGGRHSAKLVLWSFDFDEIQTIREQRDWPGVLVALCDVGARLREAGAACLVLAANTLHLLADEIASEVGLPVVHIADAVGAETARRGLQRVGLLGTRFTMGEAFYTRRLGDRFGLDVILPAGDDFTAIDDLIFDDLVHGRFGPREQDIGRRVVAGLQAAGAEAVILGCTELPELLGDHASGIPLINTTALHARAAVDFALED